MEIETKKKRGALRHGLIMLLCCLIPIAILAIMWSLGVSKSYLVIGVMLLCPLLHVVMMAGMKGGKGNNGGHVH